MGDDFQPNDVNASVLQSHINVNTPLTVHGYQDESVGIVLAALSEISGLATRPALASVSTSTLHNHITADNRLPNRAKRTIDNAMEKLRSVDCITVREDAGKNKADLFKLNQPVHYIQHTSEPIILTENHAYPCRPLTNWNPRATPSSGLIFSPRNIQSKIQI